MKVSNSPPEGEQIPNGPKAWQVQPLTYRPSKANKKFEKDEPKKKPALPRHLAYGEIVRGEYPHGEKTICCNQGCRIHDVIIMVPIVATQEVVAHGLVHASCMRKFLDTVPADFDVVQEVVTHIMDRFVDVDG